MITCMQRCNQYHHNISRDQMKNSILSLLLLSNILLKTDNIKGLLHDNSLNAKIYMLIFT